MTDIVVAAHRFFPGGFAPPAPPTRFCVRQGSGETSPKLEERRRALAGTPRPTPLPPPLKLRRDLAEALRAKAGARLTRCRSFAISPTRLRNCRLLTMRTARSAKD